MNPAARLWIARIGRLAVRTAGGILIIAAWQASVQFGWIDPYLLPAPSAIVLRAIEEFQSGGLAAHAAETIYRGVSGFLIAAAAGVLIGTLAARNRFFRWFVDPLVSIGLPAPKIALMPIFLLWFGLGDASKLMMIAITCVFPVISATFLGASSIDRYFVWSALNLGMSQRRILWRIVIPAALPQILSGLQIAFPMAMIVTVVTEMITSGGGLGGYMMRSARFALSEQVFVGIITVGVMGYVLLTAFGHFRRYLLRWHTESEAGV